LSAILCGENDSEALTKIAIKNALLELQSLQQIDIQEFEHCIQIASLSELMLDNSETAGYTYNPLACGFYALKFNNFKRAITEIILNAGDSDTNACVAGALLGCKLGFQALPREWVRGLIHHEWLDAKIEVLFELMENSGGCIFSRNKRPFYATGINYRTVDELENWYDFTKKLPPEELAQKLATSSKSKYSCDDNLNKKICLWLGDITTLEVEGIVNAANNSLLGGGGIDGAIHSSAGLNLRLENAKIGGCPTGDAKLSGGHELPATYVISTVGPIGENEPKLTQAYQSCLNLILKHRIRTVAFCCISTGIFDYPIGKATRVALKTVREWLEQDDNASRVDLIIFNTFIPRDNDFYLAFIPFYFPNKEL